MELFMERGGTATVRENRGTLGRASLPASAYTIAATIGPTSHAAGTPAHWARSPAPTTPAPRSENLPTE